MAVVTTKFDVLPPLEESDMNLEVGSPVYQLLKGFKQLQEVTLWSDTIPYRTREGFRTRFEKTLPQVVIAPYFLRNCSSHKSK